MTYQLRNAQLQNKKRIQNVKCDNKSRYQQLLLIF